MTRSFCLGDAVAHFDPGGAARPVLIVPPLGWDDLASYRPRVEWAEALAAAGHPVLRIDLPGTGDAGGDASVPAWEEAVRAAARWLEAETGRAVAAIGLGAGGLLALRADVDELVLWGVPRDGKALVRELRAFARVEAAGIVAAGGPEAPADSPLAPGGFVFPGDLAELTADGTTARRVLLLERDGIAPELQLDAEVTVAPGDGYGAMTGTPGLTRLPAQVVATVEAWLSPPQPVEAIAPTTSDALELDGVRERPFLSGILAEPTGGRAELTAVLLNAGGMRRIGPNRMWVDFARRWAARGVATLRVDLAGLGDAPGDGTRFGGDADFYGGDFGEQVRAILDALAAEGLPPRFLLGGLCSGAYWSFQTALEDDRVAAALLLNSRVLFWHDALEGRRGLRWLRRNGLRPSAWRRVLRGEIRVDLGRTLRSALRALVSRGEAEIPAALDRLRERGVAVDLVFCDGEPLRDELGPLDAWPNARLTVVPGRDHMFRPTWMHPHVHEAADRALERSLRSRDAPADRAAVPAPVGDGHRQHDA